MNLFLLLLLLLSDGFEIRPGFSVRQATAEPAKAAAVAKAADPAAASVLVNVGAAGGSGTVVASDGGKSLVLTNRHVVEHGGPCSVTCGEVRYPGRLVATDRAADLALILVDASLPVAKLATAEPARGTPVRQWGRDWRGQGKPVFKSGFAVGFSGSREMGGAGIWVSTIQSLSGDSGCGVFNEAGELVAVNWGTGPGEPQLAVGVRDVLRFLRSEVRLHLPRVAGAMDEKREEKAKARGAAPVTWHTDYDKALAGAAGKTVVVLFTDPANCLPCRKLEAGALADPAVRDELARCVCVRVEVRSEAGQALLSRFARHGDPVRSWPTVKVYKGGVRVADHVGDMPAETLLKLIR